MELSFLRRSLTVRLLAPAAAVLCLPFAGASAQSSGDFYKGKTITIAVGSSAGGGYDQYARLFARFLGQHIAGSPNIVVQDMPGGGSLTSVLYLDSNAPTDGTAMTTFNPGVMTESIVDPSQVKVNFSNVAWVGAVTPDFRICYTWKPTQIATWADMAKDHTVTLGATGKSSLSYNDVQMLRTLFSRNVRAILGYPGRSEVHLAIERGELDGECGSVDGLPPDWLSEHKINVPVRIVDLPIPGIPKTVPYIGSFAKSPDQKAILDALTAADQLGRPFIVSKKVPADRLAILRQAFTATTQDPAFLAAAKQQNLSIFPVSGEKAEAIVAKLYQVPPELAAQAKKYIQ